jgi:dihydropteroate synthase
MKVLTSSDIGGMSSRPGSAIISVEEELARVIEPIQGDPVSAFLMPYSLSILFMHR